MRCFTPLIYCCRSAMIAMSPPATLMPCFRFAAIFDGFADYFCRDFDVFAFFAFPPLLI